MLRSNSLCCRRDPSGLDARRSLAQPLRAARSVPRAIGCGHGIYAINSLPSAVRGPVRRSSQTQKQQSRVPLLLRPHVRPAATASQADAETQPWEQDWNAMGPAFKATLGLLEWPEFCEHVASFASTAVGKRLCRQLEVPLDQPTSERLLAETRCVRYSRWVWCVLHVMPIFSSCGCGF